MSAEENKALVRRIVGELDRGNLDVIDELVAPDFVDRSLLSGQEPDRESFKRSVAEMQAPFSNTSRTLGDQIAEGDKVDFYDFHLLSEGRLGFVVGDVEDLIRRRGP